MALLAAMDDREQTTQHHKITNHGTMELHVVYTNKIHTVEKTIAMYEQWLQEEKYIFIGLDIEYTRKNLHGRWAVAILQLSMREHILVYYFCRAKGRCEGLDNFLECRGLTFYSMDTSGDRKVLLQSLIVIPGECHIDIQKEFQIKGGGQRDSMGLIAAEKLSQLYAKCNK